MKSTASLKRRILFSLPALLAFTLLAGPMSPWLAKAANPPSSSTPTVNKSSSWRSEVIISHTVPAGSYRLLAVAVMIRADKSVGSITYGGEDLSLAKAQNASGLAAEQRVEIWYLVNPPVGLADLLIHLPASANPSGIVPVNFTGVNQADPIGAVAGDDGTGQTATIGITTLGTDSLIFGAASARRGNREPFTPGTDITALWDDATGSDNDDDDGLWGESWRPPRLGVIHSTLLPPWPTTGPLPVLN